MTAVEVARAELVQRWELERAGLSGPSSQEALLADLALRLEQSLEALAESMIAQEALSAQNRQALTACRYWEERALEAERQLAPRERLRLLRPWDSA